MPQSEEDRLLDGITSLVPVLLKSLSVYEGVQQRLHPPAFADFAELLRLQALQLQPLLEDFQLLHVEGNAAPVHQMLCQSAQHALNASENFSAGASSDEFGLIMRATRSHTRSVESLYPLSAFMSPVSRYFLEPALHADTGLLESLSGESGEEKVGVLNANNARDNRGGFTLYIPEYYSADQPMPLVVALHGGTGHGADFLWSWLREARGRGFMLLSPTSQQDTWSLMGPDYDAAPLNSMLDYVKQNWSVQADSILLTGLSDGATYALLYGLAEDSPFTHLAPCSGVMHSNNFMNGNLARASNKPIYLVHGSLDWMFPIETAYMARDELEKADADLVFREIEDLSHNFARAESDAILQWFNPSLAINPQENSPQENHPHKDQLT